MPELPEQQTHLLSDLATPADVCLMLRAHAELRCLSREVIPVLRQIETRRGLPAEQLGAALAYLEVTWMQARTHAAKTDAAGASLAAAASDPEHPEALSASALRYRTAVTVLRGAVAGRVATVLHRSAAPPEVDAPISTAASGSPWDEPGALLGGAGAEGTGGATAVD